MSMSALEYAQKARTLCVLPDVYLRLKEMMEDDRASLSAIADVLALDPGLSATLLKIANSALFNFPREIDSIAKAISILGMTEVHNLVNTYGATAAFAHVDSDAIDLDRFWEISVDCALICKYLAEKKHIPGGKGLFVSGLLHNLGELVVLQSDAGKVRYCQQYDKNETPWQRQQDVLGFTYADCSAELLALWQLPESLIAPIRDFHRAYGEERSPAASLLYVASRLALLNSHPGMYAKKHFVGLHILKDLGISMAELDEAVNFCNLEGLSILRALKLKKPQQ
ncbi:HDOD domain-containing protein [Thalassomonas viridans]|uniref:HDOD domain-containing protein n=1 Tax=Thalassomonas viridans TaxID=137584 RepID=A0AAE9Z639_9GAMM|nr:HDOD domain-containing protein [Thalassomonas viridans]WDE06789.1 HDOD domain-containing protein [Thalassomonas viridans]